MNSTGNKKSYVVHDAEHIKASLKKVNRINKVRALALVLPLIAFLFVAFLLPIGSMLLRSVDNQVIISTFPKTIEALADWDDTTIPDEAVFAVFASEMNIAQTQRLLGKVGTRLNYEKSGMRGLFNKTGRQVEKAKAPYKDFFLEQNALWGDLETWKLLQLHSPKYSLSYFLAAIDMHYDSDGNIVSQDENSKIYIKLMLRTIIVSVSIAFICLLLGYPVAFLLATLPVRYSNLLLILVLLPFWTSLLVRTTSWIVLLQGQGVVNDLLVFFGFTADNARFSLIYNMTGTIVAMVHILLPFMILPLFSVMKTIPPSYMRAARSLGGTPFYSFRKIYWPQTLPGIGAGSILVFVLAMGYYITPALVGGRTGQLVSNVIAYHMQRSLNWGLASALGILLLALVLIFYWLYNRVIGIDKMRLG